MCVYVCMYFCIFTHEYVNLYIYLQMTGVEYTHTSTHPAELI